MTNKNLNDDYQNFLLEKSELPPQDLDQKVFQTIEKDLNPQASTVLLKMGFIQIVMGIISLTFCPQFSYSLTNNHDVFHYFHHQFGAEVCMIICGTIFLLPGTLMACFLLSSQEIKLIRSTWYLELFAITAISLTSFFLLGVEFYIKSVFFWLIGAIGTSIILIEAQSYFRKLLLSK